MKQEVKSKRNLKKEEDEVEDRAEGGAREEAGSKKQNKFEKEENEEEYHAEGGGGGEAGGKKKSNSEKEDEEEDHAEGGGATTREEAGGEEQNKSDKDDEEKDHTEGGGARGKKQNKSEREENEGDHTGGARGEEAGGKKQNKSEKEEDEEEEDHAGGGGEGAGGEARGKDMRFKELPDDIRQLIFNRLSLLDYLNCREVSLCWQAAVDSKRWLQVAHQLPWLLHRYDLSCNYQTCHIKAENGYCFASGRELGKSKYYTSFWRCVGAVEGWLILVNYPVGYVKGKTVDFFFLNPVSGARVILPSHSVPASKHFPSVKIVASSIPTTKQSCCVTSLHFEERGRLAFCTPTDKSWTFIEDEKAQRFWDVDLVDGKLYAVGIHLGVFLVVFDIQLDPHDSRLHTYTLVRMVTVPPYVLGFAYRHLAICSESMDIFIILHQWEHKIFEVLKLEYNVSTSSSQWVDTVELGDRALFIGRVNNIFIACGDKTPEKNCIYFALDSSGKEHTSGVFSLTDRTIKQLPFPKNHQNEYHDHTLWFTPNPW